MRALLINPIERKIDEVDFTGTREHLRELLGCPWFEYKRLGDDAMLIIDEEGLLKGDGQRFFRICPGDTVFAGKALLVGYEYGLEEDYSDLPKWCTDFFLPLVEFLPESMRLVDIRTEVSVVEHPTFGQMTQVRNIPVFEGR